MNISRRIILSMLGMLILTGLGTSQLWAAEQYYAFSVDLNTISKDRYKVTLDCGAFAQDTLIFHFPLMIPGTYMEANYGRFIHDLKVTDRDGLEIKTRRKGKNTYLISPADNIAQIEYWVSGSWESPRMKTIWPMAGTGVIEDRVYAINAGGVFGYFQGYELSPVNMEYHHPENLYAMTVLPQVALAEGITAMSTSDYHKLIDSPIMFAYPDTSSFKIHDTEVMIGYAHETDDTRRSRQLATSLAPAMDAIANYIDSLPCDRYAYLVYYDNAYSLGKILDNSRFILFKGLKYWIQNGIPLGGALEHNTSSFYYLPDPGPGYTDHLTDNVENMAIHEFMHILTPLNLHSQLIEDWDYNNPVLSKHLWLYEGVTEYMAEIIQVNGKMKTPKEFLIGTMRSKIKSGEKFPLEKMSFTEMASNVLDKPYARQYLQVYQRGAVMGMLLDIEIIRLTEGRKRLIDIMLELIAEYGPEHPMDEDQIFDIFTAKVHPDLRQFFADYVEGRQALPYKEVFDHIGVDYASTVHMPFPRDPVKDTKVKENYLIMGSKRVIKKSGKDDKVGFQSGDKLDRNYYLNTYFDERGESLPAGTVVELPVLRDGKEIVLSDTITYLEKEMQHHIRIKEQMSKQQSEYFKLWLGIKEPAAELEADSLAAPDTVE